MLLESINSYPFCTVSRRTQDEPKTNLSGLSGTKVAVRRILK